MVWDSLEVAGVLYGVDNNKIEAALEEAQETDSPLLHQVVANGSIETASTDARIEHFIETKHPLAPLHLVPAALANDLSDILELLEFGDLLLGSDL